MLSVVKIACVVLKKYIYRFNGACWFSTITYKTTLLPNKNYYKITHKIIFTIKCTLCTNCFSIVKALADNSKEFFKSKNQY